MPDRDVRQASTGTPQSGGLSEASLLSCVQAAVAAPSLHNSQPWRFRIRNGGVDVYADRTRQLEVIDPSGRELLISVGAAVFNLRVAIRQQDGVPPQAFGPWAALETLPLRDYGLTQPQLQRRDEPFEPYPTILVLFTNGDTPDQWVRAGQALQRVLLLATVHGLAATPMSQPLEIPALRELVTDTRTGRWAQVILRLSYGQTNAVTPRRPLSEVLIAPP